LALCASEVAAVVCVAAKELEGEAWAFETLEAFDRLRRTPILRGHACLLFFLFVLPKEGHTTIRKDGQPN
jgi:hypothetical protein